MSDFGEISNGNSLRIHLGFHSDIRCSKFLSILIVGSRGNVFVIFDDIPVRVLKTNNLSTWYLYILTSPEYKLTFFQVCF